MKVIDLFEAKEASPEAIDKYLEMIHKMILKDQVDIDFILSADWLPDEYELVEKYKFSDEDAKICNKLSKSKLEALFKQKYGKSDRQISKEVEEKDVASMTAEQKKIMSWLNEQYSTKITPHDMKDSETGYYYHMASPQKMVINQGTNGFSLGWREEALKHHGFSIEQMKKFFDSFGIKADKRPKHKRSAPSYYD